MKILNADNTINLYYFGAKVDGVNDDLPAWNAAISYATSAAAKSRIIKVPNGVSRVTDQIIIGGEFIPVQNFINGISSVSASPASLSLYLKGAFTPTIRIIGESISCVYADFNDETKLKALFYIGAVFGERSEPGAEQYNLEISNLGLYAQGYFKNGRKQSNVDYSKNNVVGLAAAYTRGLKISEVTIVGFKEGQVFNNNYFMEENAVSFSYCQRASYDLQSHCCTYRNITNYFCGTGMEIRSNKIILDGLYSNSCKTGLYIGASNVTINSVYMESCLDTEGQVMIGDEPDANGLLKVAIENIFLNDLTIAGCNPTRTGIYFKRNVKNVTIKGATIQSQFFKYTNPLTRVYSSQILGTLPSEINVKQCYMDATGKIVTQ